ncbi:MAG: class I SAM-dependent methyltransferase, partial [Candidatus Aminicenantales bacterium]
MRRTLEKLSSQSQKKQEEFSRILEDIQKNTRAIKDRIGELKAGLSPARLKDGKKGLFPTGRSRSKNASFPESFPTQLLSILTEHQNITERVTELITSSVDLMEAKDREWDALGNHHVGMIFKSMEWRVDKLAALYGDVSLLMKTFLRLRGQLDRLLTSLEERQEPSRDKVEEVLHPLEDWRYAGFENRFRGSEEDVKTQQASFLAYFEKGGKVLDLGCGRGEFLELLEEKGIDALGVDINRQMVEICRDKGLECQEGDLLEVLMEQEDRSLGGIFSSQVIEHLPPDYLQKLIEV